MKTYFVVACSLLLFSITATFAQTGMGNVVGESLRAGDANGTPPKIPDNIVLDRTFKMAVNQPATIGNSAFGGEAKLTLKNNVLVMEKTVTELGDLPRTDTNQLWSIPFSGSANELEFQPDGDLVIRDATNKVLWAANVSGSRGKRLKMDFNGKLQIFSEHWQILWEK